MKRIFGEINRIDHLVTSAADLTFKTFLDLTDGEIVKILGSQPGAVRGRRIGDILEFRSVLRAEAILGDT